MAIQVKWHPMLMGSTKSKTPQYETEWQEGLTPRALLEREGFREVDMESIAVLFGDEQSTLNTPIPDGATIEFMVSIQGG
jgi:hypothetical protein